MSLFLVSLLPICVFLGSSFLRGLRGLAGPPFTGLWRSVQVHKRRIDHLRPSSASSELPHTPEEKEKHNEGVYLHCIVGHVSKGAVSVFPPLPPSCPSSPLCYESCLCPSASRAQRTHLSLQCHAVALFLPFPTPPLPPLSWETSGLLGLNSPLMLEKKMHSTKKLI